MSCIRFYQRKYQDDVLVVIEEEKDLDEDTRGQQTLKNMMTYIVKSAIYNFASAWNDVKMTSLSNSWKKLMLDEDPELHFARIEPNYLHQALILAEEREVSVEDVENRLEENDSDPA